MKASFATISTDVCGWLLFTLITCKESLGQLKTVPAHTEQWGKMEAVLGLMIILLGVAHGEFFSFLDAKLL